MQWIGVFLKDMQQHNFPPSVYLPINQRDNTRIINMQYNEYMQSDRKLRYIYTYMHAWITDTHALAYLYTHVSIHAHVNRVIGVYVPT